MIVVSSVFLFDNCIFKDRNYWFGKITNMGDPWIISIIVIIKAKVSVKTETDLTWWYFFSV